MTNPKISIVMPVYNPGKYLKPAVESVLGQSFGELELILVDDGSTDGSGARCDEYAQLDSRIRVIHQENAGPCLARNAGYQAAKGDWLMYVDADDWIDADTCQILAEEIRGHDTLDIIFWARTLEAGGRSVKEGKWDWNLFEDHKVYSGDECHWLALQAMNYKSGIISSWAKLFRRQWCEENGIFHNPKLRQGAEDVEFAVRAFTKAGRCLFLRHFLYHYVYNPQSFTKAVSEENAAYITDSLRETEAYIKSLKNADYFSAQFRRMAASYLIGLTMSTYFHPDNPLPYKEKAARFRSMIDANPFFLECIRDVDGRSLGKLRGIAFFCIKHRRYRLLALIARLRDLSIKSGHYKF